MVTRAVTHNTTTSPLDGDKVGSLQEVQNPIRSTDIITTPDTLESLPRIPYCNLSSLNPSPPVIGARLHKFWDNWQFVEANAWILETLRWGYKIPVQQVPMSPTPIHFPTYPEGSEKSLVLAQLVKDMLQKQAIEEAPTNTPGFYSRIFVVEKASGGWRPVIDLSTLNQWVWCPKFQMETTRSILTSITPG